MINAIVTKLIKDRGFGFATETTLEGEQLYFFHYSAIDPKTPLQFDSLKEGDSVRFERMEHEKGPRAKPRTLVLA